MFYSCISQSTRWRIGMGIHFPFPLVIISIGLIIHQIAVGTGLFLSAWSEWELSWIMITMTTMLLRCRKYQNCWGYHGIAPTTRRHQWWGRRGQFCWGRYLNLYVSHQYVRKGSITSPEERWAGEMPCFHSPLQHSQSPLDQELYQVWATAE